MTLYAFPVSREEVEKNPIVAGYGYIKQHPENLIETDNLSEINTYDKATTHVIINDEVYTIHKDYLDITNGRRIYLVIKKDYGNDK